MKEILEVLLTPIQICCYYFLFKCFLWCCNWEISTVNYEDNNIVVIREIKKRGLND